VVHVSVCEREASIMKRTWPKTDCCVMEKRNVSGYTRIVIESMTLEVLGSCSSSITGKIFSGYIVLVSKFLYKYIS